MLSKAILDQAKAFLCWEIFDSLNIQLIELSLPAAHFFPASSTQNTIVIFFEGGTSDFSRPFFLLFHEAGHCKQLLQWRKQGREEDFRRAVNDVSGSKRINFEKESWLLGKDLLEQFICERGISAGVLEQYDHFATQSITTYKE